ncbi:MAG: Ig-like domain-containing protein, partial [Gemmatimonadota bacterium]|nr:Ig-like domain-containing protein [Gemmatimonadota bacterium]
MRPRSVLVLCALLGSCAKQELPPGTPPDRAPPRSIETRPAYGETVPGLEGDAWIRFDEPISNPRSFDRTLRASPAGRYRVTPGRSRIRIRPVEGWKAGIVYYFALPAGISDLVNNRTAAPIELLFSTGGDVSPTLVQGRVYDGVTARGLRDARLLFMSADSVPYTAVSDTGGVFRLPGVPYDRYDAMAFIDQDRDFEYDAEFEPGAVEAFVLSEDTATVGVDFWILPADSTAPILASAQVIDRVTLRLLFDDPLDPLASLQAATVAVRAELDD